MACKCFPLSKLSSWERSCPSSRLLVCLLDSTCTGRYIWRDSSRNAIRTFCWCFFHSCRCRRRFTKLCAASHIPQYPQSIGHHHQLDIKPIPKLFDLRRRCSDNIRRPYCYGLYCFWIAHSSSELSHGFWNSGVIAKVGFFGIKC